MIYALLLCVLPLDGSVIFCSDGFLSKPIAKHTGSSISHTAIILYEGGKPIVFEATWPRVKRTPLDEYIKQLEHHKRKRPGFNWVILQPKQKYTDTELESMKRYARSQLGRPYMLRGWWKGREVRGIFCSQYVGNVLEKSGRIISANYKETPISLRQKLSNLYVLPERRP